MLKLQNLNKIIIILITISNIALGSVWGQKLGKYFLSVSQTFYNSETIYDRNGVKYYLPLGGIFNKYETNAYIEYGLDNQTTVFANLFYLGLSYRDSLDQKTNGGFGNQEFGFQYKLRETSPTTAFQALISFPMNISPGDPPLGNGQVDLQFSFLLGTSIGKYAFIDLLFGIRKRFEAPSDQLRSSALLGVDITKKIRLLFTANFIIGLGNQDVINTSSPYQLFQSGLNFTLFKIESALVYKFNKNISGYVGFAVDAYGRDVGGGYAFKLGIWFEP